MFAVHMAVAVTAGQLLALLPRHLVDGIVAALFLAGAVLVPMLAAGPDPDDHM